MKQKEKIFQNNALENDNGNVEEDLRELLKKGHSIDELIELFSDKQEVHDLYVNTALVYPDFETIINALKSYKERLEKEGDAVPVNCIESRLHEPSYRLFVDMDGTLAKFIPQACTAPLYKAGYFRNLPPQMNVINAVKGIMADYSNDIEVFVLTAYLNDSDYAFNEKMAWLDKYLPEIDIEHRIFIPNGENKREYISDFDENKDVLLDDYTPNLFKWMPGRAIKLLNGINGSKGTWKGQKVSMDRQPDELAKAIALSIMGEYQVYDEISGLMDFRLNTDTNQMHKIPCGFTN